MTNHQLHRLADVDLSTQLMSPLALIRIWRLESLDPKTVEAVRGELAARLEIESPTASPVKSFPSNPAQLDLRTRQLVLGGAPWQTLSEILWSDFQKSPSDFQAARILELSFVQGSPQSTIEALILLLNKGHKDFYWLLHERLREFLLEKSPPDVLEALYWIISRERDPNKPSDTEYLFVFIKLSAAQDKTAAWIYFKRHEKNLLQCCRNGTHLGMTWAKLVTKVGELALTTGYHEEARHLLSLLPQGSKERDHGLHLILRYESATIDREKNSYFIQLEQSSDWQERIQLMEIFCQHTRANGGFKDLNRPALNMILKCPWQWLPKSPDAWRALGELIIRNRDLDQLLPALWHTHLENARQYGSPDLELAFWSSAQQLTSSDPIDQYWRGVAFLHRFISSPQRAEAHLWQANECIQTAEKDPYFQTPISWRDLALATLQHVERTSMLLDRDRGKIHAVVRISLDGKNTSDDMIKKYLDSSDTPSTKLLMELIHHTTEASQYNSTAALIGHLGAHLTLENRHLDILWRTACAQSDGDLAWRSATILAARDALSPKIKYAWEISGEKRSLYSPQAVTSDIVNCALTGLPPQSKRAISALLILAFKITELTEIIHRQGTQLKVIQAPSNAIENAIAKSINNSDVIPRQPKVIHEFSGVHGLPDIYFAIQQSPESNPWIFTVRTLLDRMSGPCWSYDKDLLLETTSNILPLVGSANTSKVPAKVGRWLVSLTSPQRAAWNELGSVLTQLENTAFTFDLARFATRLAILIYPSHFVALKSLQQKNGTLNLLRDLEGFLISPSYSETRKNLQLRSRVLVPQLLKEQSIVLTVPDQN